MGVTKIVSRNEFSSRTKDLLEEVTGVDNMKSSRLNDHHAKLGAAFEEITGWQMPAHYGDVTAEYHAVRDAVGLADLSHRGKLRVTGDDRVKWLQSVISNDILPLQPGQGRYSSFLTHKGKMLTYFRCYMQADVVMLEDVGEIGDTTYAGTQKISPLWHQGEDGELCGDLGAPAGQRPQSRGRAQRRIWNGCRRPEAG